MERPILRITPPKYSGETTVVSMRLEFPLAHMDEEEKVKGDKGNGSDEM